MTAGTLRMRMASTAGVFFMLFLVAIGRVFELCVLEGPELKQLASRQHRQRVALPPERGAILDRHGNALALTVAAAGVYVRPRAVAHDENLIPALARILQLDSTLISEKVHAPGRFAWLVRQATPEQAAAIAALGLRGIGVQEKRRRHYPRGSLAAQVLGFSGVDLQGLEGVELAYDRELRGRGESWNVELDARGRRMLTDETLPQPPRQGAMVELTIDAMLQQVAEDELERAVSARRAAAGVAVIMDPATGEILALANVPRFDPNDVSSVPAERRRNRVVTDNYEPGSTFKGILAAAAIEAGSVHPEDRVFCENGSYAVGGRVVHDHAPYGWLTFADVIKHSSNIGVRKVGERLGASRLAAAIQAFGFGSLTGIDVPGEVAGLVRPSEAWGRTTLVTTSFGQGIAVTPLQLLRAYAAIANGGNLMRPYLVRRVVAPDGTVRHENRPQIVGQPISARTAGIVTDLLRGVVEGGTGTEARVDGLLVAGKTGTAQKVDAKTGRYSAHARMSSFIGFVPADAPRFVILVVIDSPQTATYGGIVAGPVFRAIAEYAVDRVGLRIASAPAPLQEPEAEVAQIDWTVGDGTRGMPSFLGLSMRAALMRAAGAGWQIDIQGSGFVVAQDPLPGAETSAGRKLTLRFGSAAG